MTEYIVTIDDLKAIVEGRDIKHELKALVRCKDCFFMVALMKMDTAFANVLVLGCRWMDFVAMGTKNE